MSENEQSTEKGQSTEKRETKPATAAQVKALIRKKKRKIPEHTEEGLNIYPMMDMMTILLVFLIMQFANDSANIVQSDALQIPYSSSTQEAQQSLAIQISRDDILVDGAIALSLRNGTVDPSQKQGGATGFLITPLHSILRQHAERLKLIETRTAGRQPFTGAVQIIADKHTPYRTLSEVMYTLGQAEFARLHFVVLQNAGN